MTTILKTGARVSSVDEEGEVTLFCYSLQRSLSFHVAPNEAKTWGARLGEFLTVEVTDEKYERPTLPSSTATETKR